MVSAPATSSQGHARRTGRQRARVNTAAVSAVKYSDGGEPTLVARATTIASTAARRPSGDCARRSTAQSTAGSHATV
jgi:hypothetical protein